MKTIQTRLVLLATIGSLAAVTAFSQAPRAPGRSAPGTAPRATPPLSAPGTIPGHRDSGTLTPGGTRPGVGQLRGSPTPSRAITPTPTTPIPLATPRFGATPAPSR